jgi:hypothetical protein
MDTILMAERVDARSNELERRAASVRMARAAGGARRRRRVHIRGRLDLGAALGSIARRFA